MDALTRRRFLVASGVTGASALAAGAGGIALADLLRGAGPAPGGGGGGAADTGHGDVLVLVTLYGGNDGLNTVVPYADRAYHSARPELAYSPESVLPLDAELGLNPMLTGLHQLWRRQRLALVLGVGYPRPDRSHFRSMDIWQTASPTRPATTGWVGRWLDGTDAPVNTAVSFEPVLPPLLVGRNRIGACVSYRGLDVPDWIDPRVVATLGAGEPGEPPMQARAAAAYQDLVDMAATVRSAQELTDPLAAAGTDDDPAVLAATGTGGASALATQLSLVARCVTLGVATRVYSVSLGGFDTHARERAGQEMLLRQLDRALTGFVDAMSRTPAGRRVTVVVYSEFGRRVRANASDGTDHGTAGPVLLLGHRVAGGRYGEQPSLTDLDDGDLKATVDFRDVFGTLLGEVLGADPAAYLDGYQPTMLPLLRPA
ncbi:DUF1501 domain-containing protein [Solwaraspora sp. WMMD406]|uniref:DUF1501 domain-containing protein n=1 Tax=Solwaraspora sp. WMMD406 TaxID=3016095 RepID=UPI0024176450|nr:DUF1501 domain-containing protein [Solwaraspora sp. WMMD406]MDG4765957.1 DUF1501 domain-containing protein [Solwaraspora sp. WMMD406]